MFKAGFIIGILLPLTSFMISFVIGVYIFNHFPGNDYYGVVRFYFMTSIIMILIVQYVVATIIQKYNVSHFLVFVCLLSVTYFFASFYMMKMYLDYIMDLLPVRNQFEFLVAYSYPFSNHVFQTMALLVSTVVTYFILNRHYK